MKLLKYFTLVLLFLGLKTALANTRPENDNPLFPDKHHRAAVSGAKVKKVPIIGEDLFSAGVTALGASQAYLIGEVSKDIVASGTLGKALKVVGRSLGPLAAVTLAFTSGTYVGEAFTHTSAGEKTVEFLKKNGDGVFEKVYALEKLGRKGLKAITNGARKVKDRVLKSPGQLASTKNIIQ